MTNKQLVEILQQHPGSLDVAVIDEDSHEVKRCSMVADISICDNGIAQEYILLSFAKNRDCLGAVCVDE